LTDDPAGMIYYPQRCIVKTEESFNKALPFL